MVVRCGSPLFLLFSVLVCQLILLSVVCLPHAPQKVARLRDTLSGLRKQIDSEKGMQERILREFRASFGDNGGTSNVRRSGSLAQAANGNRPTR